MNTTHKLTVNRSVVDKLPSVRMDRFAKDKLGSSYYSTSATNKHGETASMTTDRAKQSEDDISYVLDERSTIDENEIAEQGEEGYSNDDDNDNSKFNASAVTTSTATTARATTPGSLGFDDKTLLSMSANSSANFSFHLNGEENGDAYPALYDPALQADYEKMKLEEQKRKEEEKMWAPVTNALEFCKGGVNKMMKYCESLCV